MVTGGTSATTINSGRLRVKGISAVFDNDNDTASFTTLENGTAVSCLKFKANGNDDDAGMMHVYFGEKGIPVTGLAVTLNDADNIIYIFLT